ncbi:MAG: hypothetical protein ACOYJZ_05840 [Acutalibacter sp.]|jgi:hypothetical protein
MEDREEERKVLQEDGVEGTVLLMKDGGQPVGHVVVALEDGELQIRKLVAKEYDFTETPQGETVFVLDTLMRSAASWGEDHGADRIATTFPDFFGFFQARGFQADETHAFTPMETIVHYELGGGF